MVCFKPRTLTTKPFIKMNNDVLFNIVTKLKQDLLALSEQVSSLETKNQQLEKQIESQKKEIEDLKSQTMLIRFEQDGRTEAEKKNDEIQGNVALIRDCIKGGDYGTLSALTEQWEISIKTAVWEVLSDTEKQQIKKLKAIYERSQQEAKDSYDSLFSGVGDSVATILNHSPKGSASQQQDDDEWGAPSIVAAVEAVDGVAA